MVISEQHHGNKPTVDWIDFEKAFSVPRVGRYKARCHGNEMLAIAAYRHNLLLSEALTPFLCTIEIALRNAIHGQLVRHYRREDWWEAWHDDPRFGRQLTDIARAREKLRLRREPQSPDKVVAELTFGFWTTLLNAEYHANLWPQLRKAFPHCPKDRRKRAPIAAIANKIRILRNRAFHHEPILWVRGDAGEIHLEGLELLHWIHGGLGSWFATINRVPVIWAQWRELESALLASVVPREERAGTG